MMIGRLLVMSKGMGLPVANLTINGPETSPAMNNIRQSLSPGSPKTILARTPLMPATRSNIAINITAERPIRHPPIRALTGVNVSNTA